MEYTNYPARTEATPLEHGVEFDLHTSELEPITVDMAREAVTAALSLDRARAIITDAEGQITGYDASQLAFSGVEKQEDTYPELERASAIGARIVFFRGQEVTEEAIGE